jgi:hypothetical protein
MNRKILVLIAVLYGVFVACQKGDSTKCLPVPAVNGLRFRMEDTSGRDLLYAAILSKDSLQAMQPCNSKALIPFFNAYQLSGSADTGILIHFNNLDNPDYGAGGECYRIYFRWSNTDTDTLDWHYRLEEQNGCTQQIIDYISYNGVQTQQKVDNGNAYYRLVK